MNAKKKWLARHPSHGEIRGQSSEKLWETVVGWQNSITVVLSWIRNYRIADYTEGKMKHLHLKQKEWQLLLLEGIIITIHLQPKNIFIVVIKLGKFTKGSTTHMRRHYQGDTQHTHQLCQLDFTPGDPWFSKWEWAEASCQVHVYRQTPPSTLSANNIFSEQGGCFAIN